MTMKKRRSHEWFYGRDELGFQHRGALRSIGIDMDAYKGQPIIGIANSWSEFNNCNLTLRDVAEEVKVGVREAGGIPIEFPTISLGEELMKPTAMLYRNLMAIEVEENLRSYPVDGVVLLCNCDKTVPAQLMGAASANLPAIQLNGGPKPAGVWQGKRLGSGTDLWKLWDNVRSGSLPQASFHEIEKQLSCGPGACNVMGTASTMNAISEALGMMPAGFSTMPVGSPERAAGARHAGIRIVEMVDENLCPSDVMTREAFDNAISVLLALGGSTNAIIHLLAIAGRLGLNLTLDRFDTLSRDIPCVADVQPAGTHLIDEFHAAGGVPAVMTRIADHLNLAAVTLSGSSWSAVLSDVRVHNDTVIRPVDTAVALPPTLAILRGNLAPSGAVIKVAAASPGLLKHSGPALVFDSYDEMLRDIDDPALEVTADTVLVLRNAGPRGACGMPEWGMLPVPKKLQAAGVRDMVRISDARMSGTSFGTVVLHIAPEAAVGGPLALVQTGDRITLDVERRTLTLEVDPSTLETRAKSWKAPTSPHLRGYPRLYLDQVLQADEGCDLEFLRPRTKEALKFVPPLVGRS